MINFVTICRTLGDPIRWRIVRLVMEDALCVCELADIREMPQSTLSSHVQIIRKAGLLEDEKREKWTYFRIEKPFLKILQAMQSGFGRDAVIDPIWADDDRRAAQRMTVREQSCCPGPEKLRSRRRTSLTPSRP